MYLQPSLLAIESLTFSNAATYLRLSMEEERTNFYHRHFISTIRDVRSKEKVWDVFSTHLAGMSHGCNLAQNELENYQS